MNNFYTILGILAIGCAVAMAIDALAETPEARALEACRATCAFHGVEEFSMTTENTSCICNH